ncbi:MAG TPA: protein kinase [Methanoregulaceae archaeon]|nr:protein kinase [Methanoregulaceae archaeon]
MSYLPFVRYATVVGILLLLLLPVSGLADEFYTITSSATAGGSISPFGDVRVESGATPIFFIINNTGYKVDTVIVDQKSIGPVPVYNFPPVHSNHTILATFKLMVGSITVISDPQGASVSIDGVYYGTTWLKGALPIHNIPVGPHTVTVTYEGYEDWISNVTVIEDGTVTIRALLIPATIPPTTVPTTTVTTTVPTTTVATTVPTTTVTTTVPTTTVATTVPTTTVTTTVPTTTVTTTVPTTAATTTVPTTTVTTTVPTTAATTTVPTNVPTTLVIIPPFVGNLTVAPTEHPGEQQNTTGGFADFSGGRGAIAIILLSTALCGILASRDLISGKAFRYSPSLRNRGLGIIAYALSATGLLFTLNYYMEASGAGLLESDQGLWAALFFLMLYLCISSVVLIIGTWRAWPFSWTIKVHTATAVFLVFIGILAFLGLGSFQGAPLAMGISASLLASVCSRWQDISITRQIKGAAGEIAVAGTKNQEDMEKTRIFGSPLPDTFPKEIADRYYDIRYVGSGGIAKVFLAKKRENDMPVALKIPIHFDETAGKCFMKEIMAWEGLDHPNIVKVSEVNILPVPFVEMEYIERTLFDIPRPMSPGDAAKIILGIAEGLAYAHSKGIIHRDIKPQNILVTPDGIPKITDWGMSKVMGACIVPTLTGFSLSYAAPEQISPQKFGDTDQRTDIYQLGTLFFELVTGKIPFEGDEIGRVTSRITSEDPPRPSALNPEAAEVEPIIRKCMEKDPNKRYQSAEDLISDLRNYLNPSTQPDKYQIFED